MNIFYDFIQMNIFQGEFGKIQFVLAKSRAMTDFQLICTNLIHEIRYSGRYLYFKYFWSIFFDTFAINVWSQITKIPKKRFTVNGKNEGK
jgi:hypothetical protein